MSVTQASRIHDRSWVTQCALSRICGGCAMSLGRPIVFLGTTDEINRNAFYLPPMHQGCAEELRQAPGADPEWQLVTTAGFEFVRPGRDEIETRPTFQPNSLLS